MTHELLRCRACRRGQLVNVMDFGMMPVANRLKDFAALTPQEFPYRLAVGVCTSCWMLQLEEILPAEQLFHANYPYFSSTSSGMRDHFRGFADDVKHLLADVRDPLVVEIGSNDGIMLRHFLPMRVLGIEPSASVAAAAEANQVPTRVEFFSLPLARRLLKEQGPAHALLGANVVRHNANLHELFAAVRTLLADDGVFVFEDPALTDILETTAWDQIYDEHVYYYSLASIAPILDEHGLKVFDVSHRPVHGGTYRMYACPAESPRPISPSVEATLNKEIAAGLRDLKVYAAFASKAWRSRDELTALVRQLHGTGKRIAGYGATAKGTILLNSCKLGPDVIE